MASLTGTKIKDTYPGLIKTDDNAIVGATEKQLTDGLGNAIPMTMGTSGVSFTGGADFTGATVTGLTDNVGLVNGTGTDSLKNADSLVTTPANASAACSISIGDSSAATGDCGIAIGQSATTGGSFTRNTAVGAGAYANFASAAFGQNSCASGQISTALGGESNASADRSVAIGFQVTAAKADTVTVCELETCTAGGGIYLTTPDGTAQPKLTVNNSSELLIGGNPVGGGGEAGLVNDTAANTLISASSLTTNPACAADSNSIALGNAACANTFDGIAIGRLATVNTARGIAIGQGAITGNNTPQIAIGYQAKALPFGHAVAIGSGACARGNEGHAFGVNAVADTFSLAVGPGAKSESQGSTTVGRSTCVPSTAACGTALGFDAQANANGAVALGSEVIASKVDTVTVKSLETCVAGEGVIMTTPDGTAQYKITVDNSGNLVSTVVV